MGKFGLVPAKRRSIGVNKGRQSPRGLGISSMAIRKAPAYNRTGSRKPMYADRNQVSVLQKGIHLLSSEGNEANASSAIEQSEFGVKKAPMKVAVRVRPLNSREKTANAREIIQVSGPNMLIFDPERQQEEFFYRNEKLKDVTARKYKNLKFAFDHVYDSSGTNQIIYEDIMKPLLSTLLSGFNCSVFAYGATGSGKTYTMLGSSENRGLTYLTINDLYERLDSMKEEFETEVVISYFEVYNEQVRDLLNANGKQLTIMEVGNGIAIKDLSFHHPKDIDHLLDMLRDGNANRSQHPTDHNAESSRSHAVLQVHIRMRERHKDMNSSSRTSKLVMVDLAGSEKGCATGFSGQRFREGSSINKSLLALGKIMENLASGKRTFSFRDSKLTRILKDSLGGNCRTVMIANISPAAGLYEDTLNTLRYAQKAKKISCNASKNVITVQSCLSQYTRVMDEMTAKIQGLEKQLKEKDDIIEEKDQQLNEKNEDIQKLQEMNATLCQERLAEMGRANALQVELIDAERKLKEAEQKIRDPESKFPRSPLFQEASPTQMRNNAYTFENMLPTTMSGSPSVSNRTLTLTTEIVTEFFHHPVQMPDVQVHKPSIVGILGANETSKYLESECGFYTKTFPKLEKLFNDFQLKLEQYYKLRSLNGATGDQRYAKAMTKTHGKLYALISAVQKTLRVVKHHVDQTSFHDPSPYFNDNSPCQITKTQLWTYMMNQALLTMASYENKLLTEQVNNLTSQLLRKEDLLKDFAKLSNQFYNHLKHYGHLAPATKEKYERLVSSYCSPSLKFAENSQFIQSTSGAYLQSEWCSESFDDLMGNSVNNKRDEQITNYIQTVEQRWKKIYSRVADIPEIQCQIGNLIEFMDMSTWKTASQLLTSMISTTTDVELNSSYGSLYDGSTPGLFDAFEGEVGSVDEILYGKIAGNGEFQTIPHMSPEALDEIFQTTESQDAAILANETVTLTQSQCFNDTFTLNQLSQEEEKEVNENDDPLKTSYCAKQVPLEMTPSCSSDLYEIKTVPECVAEFSGRIGARMTKTPPTFGYSASAHTGSLRTVHYLSPGTSPSGAGPSHVYGNKQGKIPVIAPRSVSPQKTYQLGLGANSLKRVASVGKLPTSAKIQPHTSPYAKLKKMALNVARGGVPPNPYRNVLSTNKARPPVSQKNQPQQQQKGTWQRPLPKNNNYFGGAGSADR